VTQTRRLNPFAGRRAPMLCALVAAGPQLWPSGPDPDTFITALAGLLKLSVSPPLAALAQTPYVVQSIPGTY